MLSINFSNIEDLLFHDTTVQKLLSPDLFVFFEQWRIGKKFPLIKSISKQAILDVLNHLNENDVSVLKEYFGENIVIERLDYGIVKNIQVPLSDTEICQELCSVEGFNYFGTWRDDEYLYISFWR